MRFKEAGDRISSVAFVPQGSPEENLVEELAAVEAELADAPKGKKK